MNGYVEKDGQKYLWVGKRSKLKPTYPGMLDHLVAGGLVIVEFLFYVYHLPSYISTGMLLFLVCF